ncbi:hypothetical protein DFH09DRAFT_1421594 [Mycena vulgaris]|nr:hypothetical protein DFH09DRAFT_1421594 [Mycena vulgaris]
MPVHRGTSTVAHTRKSACACAWAKPRRAAPGALRTYYHVWAEQRGDRVAGSAHPCERAGRSSEARSGVGTERAHGGVAIRAQDADARAACTDGFGRLEHPIADARKGADAEARTSNCRTDRMARPVSFHYCFDVAELDYRDGLNNTILVFTFRGSPVYNFCDAFRTGGGLTVLEFSSFVDLVRLFDCPRVIMILRMNTAVSSEVGTWLKLCYSKYNSTAQRDLRPSSALSRSPPSSPLPTMSSLTRQRTLDSVRSWWSDSNPTGPNINLHALAKPLMKLMYHRQTLHYIDKNRGKSLSRENMETYASYLGFKYASSATKAVVLRELAERAKYQEDARTVADIISFYLLNTLLESRHTNVQGSACRLLGALASWRLSRTRQWAGSVCKSLVLLLRDETDNVRLEALLALGSIATSPGGAEAVVNAHASAGVAWAASISKPLVLLLRGRDVDEYVHVVAWGDYSLVEALRWIAKSPEGAQILVDADILNSMNCLLDSSSLSLQREACKLLRALASHGCTVTAVLRATPWVQLVSLCASRARLDALSALAQISGYPEGVAAIVATDILANVSTLMASQDRGVQLQTCIILRNLCWSQPRGQGES